MQEARPLTFREFLDSDFNYVFPAPGGAIASGAIRSNDDADLYMAALACKAKAKTRENTNRSATEYLTDHMMILTTTESMFPHAAVNMTKRISEWLQEIAN